MHIAIANLTCFTCVSQYYGPAVVDERRLSSSRMSQFFFVKMHCISLKAFASFFTESRMQEISLLICEKNPEVSSDAYRAIQYCLKLSR